MFRLKVGILAVVLLAAGIGLAFYPNGGAEIIAWSSGCRRVGLVLAVLWLALPELQRLPIWYAVAAVGVLIVLARFPRYLIGAVIVAILILLLRPRMRAPDGRNRRAG